MIVILGSPNGPHGELLSIALSRLEKGIEEAKKHPHYLIACTGGVGPFNQTDKPHAFYAKQYLLKRGIAKERIAGLAESKNTVEDAYLLKPIVEKEKVKELLVVTSDFHMPRVRFIFENVFPNLTLSFSAAKTEGSAEEYAELCAVEKKKLEWHHKNGVSKPF